MGAYTQSIREILQMNKTPQQKLTNVQDVYDIASNCLFDEMPQDVISDDYLEQFVTGFTLHFMNEELGLETLPLWKIALNEKIYNSGTYINKIFENLDKEIFAEYNVKSVTDSGTTSGTKSFAGSVSDAREILTSSSDNDTKDITKKGSEFRIKGGQDELEKKGSEGTYKSGDDTLQKSGSEFTLHGGKDSTEKKGSEYQVNVGSDINEDRGYQDNLHSSATDAYLNGVQINSDTPMGSLNNLRTPGGAVAVGAKTGTVTPYQDTGRDLDVYGLGSGSAGQAYDAAQTYSYMSSASENGQTQSTIENGNDKTVNHNDVTAKHGHGVSTSFGVKATPGANVGDDPTVTTDKREDINDYDSHDSITYGYKKDKNGTETPSDREDKTTYNSGQRIMYGKYTDGQGEPVVDKREDINKYGGEETIRYGKYKDGEGVLQDDDRIDNIMEAATHSSVVNDNNSQMTSNNEMTSGSHANSVGQIDHSLNWEMLYKSMPLLNKVWEIFDDLFMLIY